MVLNGMDRNIQFPCNFYVQQSYPIRQRYDFSGEISKTKVRMFLWIKVGYLFLKQISDPGIYADSAPVKTNSIRYFTSEYKIISAAYRK